MPEDVTTPTDPRDELRADCTSCAGLCCVAPSFAASSDFAADKPAGQPCSHLRPDFRCGIHGELRERGFPGCTVYDCFGAGQKLTQLTFGGQDWRGSPQLAESMFSTFTVLRHLHELLWYLTEALSRCPVNQPRGGSNDEPRGGLLAALEQTERLARGGPDQLRRLDMAEHHQRVNALLLRTSELVRAPTAGPALDRRGADLAGKNLRGADLRGANLRGTLLIGADLRGADLGLADLIGADLRGTDLRGADLGECLFLTQFQANAARGDRATTLPRALTRPAHWT